MLLRRSTRRSALPTRALLGSRVLGADEVTAWPGPRPCHPARAGKHVDPAVPGRYTWAMGHDGGPVSFRVLSGPGGTAADVLAALPGADLTTVQLEVARRRAARLSGPDVLRRHREDR